MNSFTRTGYTKCKQTNKLFFHNFQCTVCRHLSFKVSYENEKKVQLLYETL